MKSLFIFLFLSTSIYAEFKAKEIYRGDSVVWGFDFINSDELLINHKSGELFYYNLKTKEKIKQSIPPVKVRGQGGLLDILFHKNNVYYTFVERHNQKDITSLAKANYKNKKIFNAKVIFRTKLGGNTGRHFGSRLVIRDDLIYMTVGDRGERKYAQKLQFHDGSILRLTLDGKAAANNPFIKNKNALAEIYSYGHRNPQGISIDPVSGNIFSCEFGPRGGDELNLIKPGKNYGWPVITYGKEYWGPSIGPTHKEGMEQPLTYWVPSISPSGMTFYTGDKISKWKNNLFLANLSSKHLRRLVLKNNQVIEQEELFNSLDERIRQVRNGKDGYLYFSTDSGKIFKVTK
jgi:glucose/arabinose dehydrogenase